MYDVITVGSSTVDVFAKTAFSELITIKNKKGETDLLAYPSGSKILISELDFTTGGGGTNSAVSLSRLGHKVGYLGKLGDDCNKYLIIDDLKKEKIDIIAVTGKGQNGYSVILDSLEHDRTILTHKGVNDDLRYNELPLKKLQTKWFYFASMMGESFTTMEKLSVFAKKNKIKFLFNPSSYLAEKGQVLLKKILSNTTIIVLNKQEAILLTKKTEIKDLLRALTKLGPKIAVITEGKKGVYAYDKKYIYYGVPHPIKPLETTGAGDAFASSFLSGIIRGKGISFSIKLGITNAESVISHHGAKNKLLDYKEALKILKKRPVKVKKKKLR